MVPQSNNQPWLQMTWEVLHLGGRFLIPKPPEAEQFNVPVTLTHSLEAVSSSFMVAEE